MTVQDPKVSVVDEDGNLLARRAEHRWRTGFVTDDDLDVLWDERRQLNERVSLKLEDGTVLARGYRPLSEFEVWSRSSRGDNVGFYTIGYVERHLGFSRVAIERVIRTRQESPPRWPQCA